MFAKVINDCDSKKFNSQNEMNMLFSTFWEQQTNYYHFRACQIKVLESIRLPLKILSEWSLENLNQDEKTSSSVTLSEILHCPSRITKQIYRRFIRGQLKGCYVR